MHHCCLRRGLRTFFQIEAHRLIRQALHHSQFHHPVGQQLQRSVVVALRRIAARQGNQVGLITLVVHLAETVGLDPVPQHPVQSSLGVPPLDAVHRALGHVQGRRYLRSIPAFIYLQQDAGTGYEPLVLV